MPADLDFVQMAVVTYEIANVAVVGTVCKRLPKLLPLDMIVMPLLIAAVVSLKSCFPGSCMGFGFATGCEQEPSL